MKQFMWENRYWFFCIALSLHNIEEGVFLPQWSSLGKGPVELSPFPFRITLVVITALAILLTLWKDNRKAETLLRGYVGVMFLNIFTPHLLGSLIYGEILPGTITAILCILPSTIPILISITTQKGAPYTVKATLLSLTVLIVIIPVTYLTVGVFF